MQIYVDPLDNITEKLATLRCKLRFKINVRGRDYKYILEKNFPLDSRFFNMMYRDWCWVAKYSFIIRCETVNVTVMYMGYFYASPHSDAGSDLALERGCI